MKLKDKVCTYEQAKKLKELGFERDSFMMWGQHKDKDYEDISLGVNVGIWSKYSKFYPAYDVTELGEILPSFIDAYGDVYNLTMTKFSDGYSLGYLRPNDGVQGSQSGKTEAQARAKLLIWLIEEGKIQLH